MVKYRETRYLKGKTVAVDSVVWHWLSMTVEDVAVIHDGLGHAVGRSFEVFYVNDGLIGSRYP